MAAVTYLEKRPEVESQLIGVVGHSSGGMMAIAAASKDVRIKAVAVWATIANYGLFLKLLRSRKFFFYSQWALLHKMRNEFRGNDFPRQLTNLRDMDPLSCVKKISPRPLLIIHEKDDLIMSVEHAYDLYEKAREPKKLVIGKGKMHSDADPFYSAVERDDGAIRITLDWFNNIFKNKAYSRKNPENTKLGDEK
jgi:dipeptidyl aminopeptidase/acylaminoacyl peptidase